MVALLVLDEENGVNGASHHAESVLQDMPVLMHIHLGFILIEVEPRLALNVVELFTADARVDIVSAEGGIQHLGININTLTWDARAVLQRG